MGKTIGISEFLSEVNRKTSRSDRVAALKSGDCFPLRTVLQGAFDPRLKWRLPEGVPPYIPTKLPDQEGVLIRECKNLAKYVEGGAPNMKAFKVESQFVQLLQQVSPEDAVLLCAVKDKRLPYENITEDVVREAFPDLLEPPVAVSKAKRKPDRA